jgi:HPt (histidine-containing phosphotransfer) domain-containing protein
MRGEVLTGAPLYAESGNEILFDRASALSHLDGDQELLADLIQIFLAEYPETIAKLRRAADSGDAEAVAVEAHMLKGSISNFGASKATELAFAIEKMGRGGTVADAPAAVARLSEMLETLRPQLSKWASEPALPDR